MEGILNLETIISLLTIISVIVGVVIFITRPDAKADKTIATLREKVDADYKIILEKMTGLDKLNSELCRQRDNHLHTIEMQTIENQRSIVDIGQKLVKLETLLKERLPKR
jgi:hypothetical protein